MAKVTFEFDETEDRDDINLIVNRYKLVSALYDIQDYRRSLYKGYIDERDSIVVKDNKVVYKDGEKLEDYDIDNAICYIKETSLINKLDDIIDKVYKLIN